MLFNSFIFLFFLLAVVILFYISSKNSRKILILVSSYIFYGYWDYTFTSLLVIKTVLAFYFAREISISSNDKYRKKILIISIIINLGILAFFKYYNFFIDSFNAAFQFSNVNLDFVHLNILLPIGISFYTFQTVSYTVDVYKREMTHTNNLLDFSIFVAFFPQLIAGPIDKARDLFPQISRMSLPHKEQIEEGVVLIVFGLFKKVLIGDTTSRIVNQIFDQSSIYKGPELLIALILFSIQIYADFSGYSNIARGTAKLLGIDLIKNFNQPYLSKNITEFWGRWHISLSSWLKEYLYVPLGGNRKGELRTKMNLMLTMLIGGLWHGASWNFVIWGGLHGFYLVLHKQYVLKFGSLKISLSKYADPIISILITYIFVLFAWLFFRSPNLNTSISILSSIYKWEHSEIFPKLLLITISFFTVTLLIDLFESKLNSHTFILQIKNKSIILGVLIGIFLTTLLYMFTNEPVPFMYFQF